MIKAATIFRILVCCSAVLVLTSQTVFSQAKKTSGFAEVNGGKLYYEVAGTGKAIVFVHGGLVDSRLWDDQFNEFARKYRVVRYDVRGHGRSPLPAEKYSLVEDLAQLLKFLKIEKASVVGLSLGGVIAADFALEYAEMTETLVLVGSGLRGFNSGKTDEEGGKIFAASKKSKPDEAAKMWLAHPLLAGVKNRPKEREKMLRLMTDNHAAYTQIDHAKIYQMPEPPTYQRLNKITAPTLVIIGDLDHPFLIANATELKAKISNTQLVTMRGLSHHPNLEKPKEFNKVLQRFLREKIR